MTPPSTMVTDLAAGDLDVPGRALTPEAGDALAVADPAQEASRAVTDVLTAVGSGGHHVVLGAPGSGRSTLAVEIFTALAQSGGAEDLLLIAPTRRAADRLRNAVAARLQATTGVVMVRTAASFAFSVLRARSALLGLAPPSLLTGAEQDAVLTQLLQGHAEGVGRDPRWPQDIPREALTLAAFRHELRDVLMRAAEAGWDGHELENAGTRLGREAWAACGRVLQEYEEVTRLGETTPDRGTRYDVASILDEAVLALAAWDQELPQHPRPRLRAVIHDDYQDASFATARLLRVLADDGAQLVLLGDPDVAVQTFRGAVPALLERASAGDAARPRPRGERAALGELGATTHVLPAVWRGDASLRAVVERTTAGLPPLGDVRRRRARAVTTDADSSVATAVLRSVPQEARYIAHRLRDHHLRENVPWERMAVLARSSGQLSALRRGLRTAGVPVATAQGEVPLRAEPAVRPLLQALQLVASAEVASAEVASAEVATAGMAAAGAGRAEGETAMRWDSDLLTELLLSVIGGMDSVGLRALRRALRTREAEAGGNRASNDLLADLVHRPEEIDRLALPLRIAGPVRRVARVLTAGLAAHHRGEGLEAVLWALWEATGLATVWRRRAVEGGPGAERADSDLDAVIALFRAAEQFALTGAGAAGGGTGIGIAGFIETLQAQEFAPDTLARTGRRRAVQVLTAASAAGQEWDVVVVAGLQEEVWPDLRLRARLLDPVGISEVAAGRSLQPVPPGQARRAVLADEQRLLTCAVSRARRHLLLTAVQDGDTRPSPFLDLVDPPSPEADEQDLERTIVEVPPPLDLRGLVATLRAEVLRAPQASGDIPGDGTGSAHRHTAAAQLLNTLARAGVPGAAVADWWGAALSSTTALRTPTERVPVSPSDLVAVGDCPLRWMLQRAGGRDGRSESRAAAELGILIHTLAEEFPSGGEEQMQARMAELWPSLDLGTGWPARRQRTLAEAMVRRLAGYLESVPGRVRTEVSFEVQIGRADLRGRMDRVEDLEDGAVRVVDLKTGSTAVSKAEGEVHPQLAAYQAALLAGAVPDAVAGGARLVYVGGNRANAAIRDQSAVTDPGGESAWVTQLVLESAEVMAGERFEARVGPGCRTCALARCCPAQDDGARAVGR